MLFIVIAAVLVRRPWTATITCIVQALLVIISGVIGSHGILSLFTYVIPGLMVDIFYLLIRKQRYNSLICFFMGMIANMAGTFSSNLVFFRLPAVPLMLSLFAGALSGGLGGLVAWGITKSLKKHLPVFNKTEKEGYN